MTSASSCVMGKKICHITSVHGRYDARILGKECTSLAKNGYDVTLLVNDVNKSELVDGVKITSTEFSSNNRFERMVVSMRKIKEKAEGINADIYHLHDPELLILGYYLKKQGKKIIFDSHEDYLLTIKAKDWIPAVLRKLVQSFYKICEKRFLKKFDGAIVCYHWTKDRYQEYCKHVEMVLNFPIIPQIDDLPVIDFSKRSVSFAGGINPDWCHKEILSALAKTKDVKYELAGKAGGDYFRELQEMPAWKQVNYHGALPQKKVYSDVYGNSAIGLALLDYIPQCKGKIGNLSNTKFFEYMLLGLPLICTDFKLWKDIVFEEKCGVCVNPHNPGEIAEAIMGMLNNPELARNMGKNGQRAVFERYNWLSEEKKLLNLYEVVSK